MNAKYVYDEEQMKKCWKQFISGQKITGRVRPEILSAWERCRKLKTDPYKKAPKRLTDEKVIAEKLAQSETLLKFSKPAIKYLYRFLQDVHLFAAVSDADGYLLAVYGDTSAIDPDHNILYTCWSEARLGNNPIGTSLYKGSPTQTFGYEHYCIFPHHFSGAGAPIHDPKGRIIGGISITHVADSPHPHTLAMIVMTAYAIERSLRQEEAHQRTLAAYSHLQIVLDSISDGILVLGQDHQITMVNQPLCKFLHVSQEMFIQHPISEFVRDRKLLDAISNASVFDDYVTDLRLGNQVFHCTITSRYTQNDDYQNQILIINDYNRIQKLASKLTDTQTKHTFENMVIGNSIFRKTADIAHSIALNDSNVLLLGESGTGKDVLAQAIHNGSPRANGPFIPINCGAIQKELVTSELFGYEEGAFTGSKKGGAIGKLEYASGGTLFLDEIGEMPLDVQPVLLRAIEQRVITRVGGKKFIPIDVRIIAATNRDLYQEVQRGNFRQDLYYRLKVFCIEIPSLRERIEDVPLLASTFLHNMNMKYGKSVLGFSDEAMQLLCSYPWPGNIRELQNCVERCVALTTGPLVLPETFPPEILLQTAAPSVSGGIMLAEQKMPSTPQAFPAEQVSPASRTFPAGNSHRQNEAEQLQQLLEHYHWNITKVSQQLGITRATVYRRMKALGLEK